MFNIYDKKFKFSFNLDSFYWHDDSSDSNDDEYDDDEDSCQENETDEDSEYEYSSEIEESDDNSENEDATEEWDIDNEENSDVEIEPHEAEEDYPLPEESGRRKTEFQQHFKTNHIPLEFVTKKFDILLYIFLGVFLGDAVHRSNSNYIGFNFKSTCCFFLIHLLHLIGVISPKLK